MVITAFNSLPFIIKFIYEILNPPKHMTVGHRRIPVSFDYSCCCKCKKKSNQYINLSDTDDETKGFSETVQQDGYHFN